MKNKLKILILLFSIILVTIFGIVYYNKNNRVSHVHREYGEREIEEDSKIPVEDPKDPPAVPVPEPHGDEIYIVFVKNGATSLNGKSTNDEFINISCINKNKKGCTVKAPSIERNGYEILGFSTNYNSKTVEYKVNQDITIYKNGIKLYAITKKVLTLSYNSNGGNGNISSDSCAIYNGESYCQVKVKSNSFTKNNSIFLNWSDDSYKYKGYENSTSYKRILKADDTINLYNDKTLKAYWLTKLNNEWTNLNGKTYDNNYQIKATGDILTGSYNIIQPKVVYVGDNITDNLKWVTDNGKYKYLAYFYAWIDSDSNTNTSRFHFGYNNNETLYGGDSIYLARSTNLEGPWEVYSHDANGNEYFEKRMTREGAINWYMILGTTMNSTYETNMVGDPSVVYKDGVFYMAYSACGLLSTKKNVAVATKYVGPYVISGAWSNDGVSWYKLGQGGYKWELNDAHNDTTSVKGKPKPIAKWWNEDYYWQKYYNDYLKTGVYKVPQNYKGGYQRPSLLWDNSTNKWKIWYDGSNGNTGYSVSKTSDFLHTDWTLYAEYEQSDMNKVMLSTVENDTKEINKSKLDYLPVKWTPYLNASMYFDTMPDASIIKVGNKYYAAATPYLYELDKFGTNRLLYNPKNHNPNYNVKDSSGNIDIAWPGRQITLFESKDGLNWELIGYFEPDNGFDATQTPELFYDKSSSKLCVFYSLHYGSYASSSYSTYDWRFIKTRGRCKKI